MPLVPSVGASHGALSANGLQERFLNVIEAINEHKAQRADALSSIVGEKNQKGVSQNYSAENRVLLKAAFTYFFPHGVTLSDTYQNEKELTLVA